MHGLKPAEECLAELMETDSGDWMVLKATAIDVLRAWQRNTLDAVSDLIRHYPCVPSGECERLIERINERLNPAPGQLQGDASTQGEKNGKNPTTLGIPPQT